MKISTAVVIAVISFVAFLGSVYGLGVLVEKYETEQSYLAQEQQAFDKGLQAFCEAQKADPTQSMKFQQDAWTNECDDIRRGGGLSAATLYRHSLTETKADPALDLVMRLEAKFNANIAEELASGKISEKEAQDRREAIQFIY